VIHKQFLKQPADLHTKRTAVQKIADALPFSAGSAADNAGAIRYPMKTGAVAREKISVLMSEQTCFTIILLIKMAQ
jgi:hypothetical protein